MLNMALVSPVSAVSPDVVNIGVGTKGKYVVMNARLIDGFTEKIQEAINNGVPWVLPLKLNSAKPIKLVTSLVK